MASTHLCCYAAGGRLKTENNAAGRQRSQPNLKDLGVILAEI